ncbi:DeoR family transcriptional regulator [Candidatus Azambacteria bacterium]|nr:DeoR family transcriptional regulator [Candidatus Azambacteria bacterium]
MTERMSDDVLKTRVRVLAEEIFELFPNPSAVGKGKILESLLKLCEELNQGNSLNFQVLLREYEKLFHEIEQVVPKGAEGVKPGKPPSRLRPDLDRGSARRIMAKRPAVKERHRERHREIARFLKNRGEARLRDISSLFPNISQRMVRKDLSKLVRMGNIRREGKGQGSRYLFIHKS